MATKTWNGSGDNWTTAADWTPSGEPGTADDVVVSSGDPQVTTNVGTIASLAITGATVDINDSQTTTGEITVTGATTNTGGTLSLNDGGAFVTGSFMNAGNLSLSGGVGSGTGGTSVTVNGLLDNTGSIDRGSTFDQRTAGDTITTQQLTNTGSISFGGSSGEPTELEVTQQQAGFGTAGDLTGQISLSDNSQIVFDEGGSLTAIGTGTTDSNSGLTLDGTQASISNGQGAAVNSALTTLNDIGVGSGLSLDDGATLDLSGNLQNDGAIHLGADSVGGTKLEVAGTITNTSNGSVTIAATSGNDTITAAGITQTNLGANGGYVSLTGSAPGASATHLAELQVSGAAGFGTAGLLQGGLSLTGDAVVQFGSGAITTLGDGTSSGRANFTLDGTLASVSSVANGGGQDSGLALASITEQSVLNLADGATLATGNLDNAGSIGFDTFSTAYGTGGTTLTVNGTLTNEISGSISIEPRSGQDTLVVHQAAGFGTVGTLTGSVFLDGVNGAAVIQFDSGGLSTIAAKSGLTLDGQSASIQDGTGSQNGALGALTENDGFLGLENGASLTSTGNLDNTGQIQLYNGSINNTLTINGTLTNSGSVDIDAAANHATINVTAIDNVVGSSTGTIDVEGAYNVSQNTTYPALLNVSSAAGFGTQGVLTGNVDLANSSTIQFTSGFISTIAAKSSLQIDGGLASITDSGEGQNDALAGLTENEGDLTLLNGVDLTTDGSLTNTGTVTLSGGNTVFGSTTVNNTLDIGGSLTNSGYVQLYAENDNTATIDTTAIDNVVGAQTGSLDIEGAYNTTTSTAYAALLNVSGTAGFGTQGVLTGNVYLGGDSGGAVIAFGSGGITEIAASSKLTLDGTLASIQDGASGATNGALTGLSSIAGTLTLEDGAVLATGGAATGAANTLTVGDTLGVSGRVNATTVDVVDGGDVTLTNGGISAAVTVENGGTFAGTGTTYGNSVTVASGGTFNPGGDPGAISTGSLSLASGSTFAIDLGGTPQSGAFDQDDVSGTVSLGGATLSGAIVDGYTPTVGDTFEIISNDGSDAVSGTFAGLAQGADTIIDGNEFQISYTGGDGNDVTLTDLGTVCFASGTRIRTKRGDVEVERLAAGDLVVTVSGDTRPIRWLGHRSLDCRRHPRPAAVLPIRIAAHALAANRPARDLVVSPGHAICVDILGEVLVPAALLVDGEAVRQLAVDDVTYWHVELDDHEVILAENLPAESYLDMGNRGFFREADVVDLVAGPDAGSARPTHAAFCRPFVDSGPMLDAIRARLHRRAAPSATSRVAPHVAA